MSNHSVKRQSITSINEGSAVKMAKSGNSKESPNEDIIKILKELGEHEINIKNNRFKFAAYQKAAKALETLDHRVESGYEARTLGIGNKIGQLIDKILTTGTLKKVVVQIDENNSPNHELTRVAGIGPSQESKLSDESKDNSVADLKARNNVAHLRESIFNEASIIDLTGDDWQDSTENVTKAGSSQVNPNEDIIKILTGKVSQVNIVRVEPLSIDLGEHKKIIAKQTFICAAYQKAAKLLEPLDHRVKSVGEARTLGIGRNIAAQIGKILSTGTLEEIEVVRADETFLGIHELTRVTGIGPSCASKLFYGFKVNSVDDLKANKNGVINALNHHQMIGLKYFDDFEQRIPRDEVEQLRDAIFKEVAAVDEDFVPTVCGSFRRGAATCGDIDVLLTHPKLRSDADRIPRNVALSSLTKILESANIITDTLVLGDKKFMGVCVLPEKLRNGKPIYRRLDIRLIPHDHFYCALLYFTGSDMFNKRMRQLALKKGLTINEYSIRPLLSTGVPGEALPVTSEQDVFDYVGMEYKEPKDRIS